MSFLPPNKPKKTIESPRNFFIWGQTMHGKSYLASEFPNPIILNTDGNAEQIETPSVDLKNERDPRTGEIKTTVVEQMLGIIKELEQGKHSFETVVIDVIDDLITLIEQAICEENEVDYVGDVPYGKGWGLRKTFITSIVVRLKALPMNVIYISRYATKLENNVEKPIPSLGDKDLNVVNGNCDLNIMCQKIGKNYIRRVVDRRKNYKREWIEDERILSILDSVTGAFEKKTGNAQAPKTEAPVVKAPKALPEKKSLAELAEEVSVQEPNQESIKVELEDGVTVEVNDGPKEEPRLFEEDKYYYHPESDSYTMFKKGEEMPTIGDIDFGHCSEITKEQYEAGVKKEAEIEQYIKDNPPPEIKAPRTARPRAPRAPRTK